jgi:hypothetical protein
MDRFTRNNLHLNKSDEDIHASLEKFAIKWQRKAVRAAQTDRISRF